MGVTERQATAHGNIEYILTFLVESLLVGGTEKPGKVGCPGGCLRKKFSRKFRI